MKVPSTIPKGPPRSDIDPMWLQLAAAQMVELDKLRPETREEEEKTHGLTQLEKLIGRSPAPAEDQRAAREKQEPVLEARGEERI